MNWAILLTQKHKFSRKGQDEDMQKLHHQALFPVVYKKTHPLYHMLHHAD